MLFAMTEDSATVWMQIILLLLLASKINQFIRWAFR